jgi:hypothetical protein
MGVEGTEDALECKLISLIKSKNFEAALTFLKGKEAQFQF